MTIDLAPLPKTATPDDYLRLQFDASNVSSKRIVGLLACQRDPLLQFLTTRIHAVRPAAIAAVPTQKGKGQKKKDKSAPSSGAATPAAANGGTSGAQTPVPGQEAGRLWEVELEDTVIFPEGGGQPSDTGTLTFDGPTGSKQTFRVEMCIRKKLDSIHLVRVYSAEEAFFAQLKPGEEVVIDVDWERRMDQMTIHTAQHLLSAMLDLRSLPTLSWAMHAHPSLEHPYVELQRQLTWQEAEEVEAECNRLIDEAKKIWIEVCVQGQAERDGVDGRHAVEPEDGERESRGLPKDYAGLPHLGLISQIHIIPPALSSTSTSPSQSATKLYFTAGHRARRYFAQASREMSRAAQALGSGRENLAERAQRAEELKRQGMSDGEALRKELAKVLGEKEWKAATRLAFLTAQSGDREKGKAVEGQDEVDGKPQGVVVFFDRAEAVTHDFDFLGLLATSVQAASESSTGDRPLYPLTICLSGLNTTPGGLLLVQSKDDALAKSVKERISAALNGLPISTDSGSTTPAQGAGEAKGDGEAGGGAKSAKAVPRVKGGGAKGRYMCKIDGKLGKREREAVEKVVEEIRVELAAA